MPIDTVNYVENGAISNGWRQYLYIYQDKTINVNSATYRFRLKDKSDGSLGGLSDMYSGRLFLTEKS